MDWPLSFIVLPPAYFGGVVGSLLGVVLEPELGVEEFGVVDVPDLLPEEPVVDPELLDPDPVELFEAVLEALEDVAVGVVPVGVVNIGT